MSARKRLGLVTIKELGEMLGINYTDTYRMVKNYGDIPPPKVKRGQRSYYTREQVEEIKKLFPELNIK